MNPFRAMMLSILLNDEHRTGSADQEPKRITRRTVYYGLVRQFDLKIDLRWEKMTSLFFQYTILFRNTNRETKKCEIDPLRCHLLYTHLHTHARTRSLQ